MKVLYAIVKFLYVFQIYLELLHVQIVIPALVQDCLELLPCQSWLLVLISGYKAELLNRSERLLDEVDYG